MENAEYKRVMKFVNTVENGIEQSMATAKQLAKPILKALECKCKLNSSLEKDLEKLKGMVEIMQLFKMDVSEFSWIWLV